MGIPCLLLAIVTNITGWVTFEREGFPFCFVKEVSGESWRVSHIENVKFKVGDKIIAKGERERSAKNRLDTSSVTFLDKEDGKMPEPRKVTINELFKAILPFGNRSWYAERLETQGILRDINRRQNSTQLLVGWDENNLQVEIPLALEEALPKNLVQGALVRIIGNLAYTSIENFEEGLFGRIENIELIPLSVDDIQVVKHAPFWTAERLRNILYVLLGLCVLAFIWAVSLRRMVAHRTRELGESIRLRETERIEADAARRERLRLASDLHDGFQQYLAGAMFRLKAAMNYLPKDALESRVQLDKVKDALQHTQNGLRSTLWAMNEESEGPESIMSLFEFTARRMPHWEGVVDIACEGKEYPIARRNAGTLLLIMQEAVGNALKHGKAEHIRVRLSFRDKEFTMMVIDDGEGFDSSIKVESQHYGLANMERRTSELRGTMAIWSKRRLGSKLTFTFPCEQ